MEAAMLRSMKGSNGVENNQEGNDCDRDNMYIDITEIRYSFTFVYRVVHSHSVRSRLLGCLSLLLLVSPSPEYSFLHSSIFPFTSVVNNFYLGK
jgi:hypothetical protein